jgi:predicted O-methyltransferase YrrM
MVTIDDVVGAAQGGLGAYAERVRGLPYERKGILYSEVFFLSLCVRASAPKRILESGRARGQSTLLLAVCFPDLPIISLEHDPASPDVPVAAERLRGRANVDLQFGDATRVLPRLAQPGDIALIDGPKGWRGIRLALRVLAEGRVRMVFVHDVLPGTPERRFLERWLPQAIYSDHPKFAALAHPLDAGVADSIPAGQRWRGENAVGYGYSLACLQAPAHGSLGFARLAAVLAGLRRGRSEDA